MCLFSLGSSGVSDTKTVTSGSISLLDARLMSADCLSVYKWSIRRETLGLSRCNKEARLRNKRTTISVALSIFIISYPDMSESIRSDPVMRNSPAGGSMLTR